jgi:hypothetical protein
MGENNQYEVKTSTSFPSQLDPFEKKITKEFGLSIGSSISAEWFSTSGGGKCRFYTSQYDFYNRRNYANGLVNMKKYHSKLGTNGDVSLLNLSNKPLTRLPKLVNLLVNGMCDRGYTVEANAIDPVSQSNKQKYRQKIKDDRDSKEIIDLAKEKFGIDIGSMPTDKLPETDDELSLHLQLEYKPSCELSAQMTIQAIMMENMYDLTIDRQGKRDLIVDGAYCVMNRFNPSKGIDLQRVDFADMVYSQTDDPYFRDCFYKGHIKKVLTSDVLIEYLELNNLENKDVKEQLMNQGAWWNRQYNLQNKIKGYTYLLYFTYKTTKEEYNKVKQKSNGEKIYSKAKSVFNENVETSKKDKYKRVSKVEEVLFEGCMVLGTNIMLKWEVAKSMARPNSNKQKVCEQYNMIAPNFENGIIISPVSLMIPIEDMLNLVELKAEQILQRINPDGVAINLDAIAGVELGDGKPYGAKEAFDMWLQSGSYFYRGDTLTGEYNNNQKPFEEIRTGDSLNKLIALRNENKEYLAQLTDVIGLNQYSDASNPDKDSLVGIGKLASLNSNLATRHILVGAGYITLKTAEAIIYRVQDIIRYYPNLKEDFIRKIGATAVEDLDSISNLHLSDFALNLYLDQDDEEKALLDQDLTLGIQQGLITIADKYKVKNIKIHKQAIAYLTVLIEKSSKKQQEQKAQEAQQKSDMDIRTSEQANAFAQQTIAKQLEADQLKYDLINKGLIDKEKEATKGLLELETLKGKNALELQLLVNSGKVEITDKLESDKKERIDKQSSNQSEMIHQRETGKNAIDFEAKNAENAIFELD